MPDFAFRDIIELRDHPTSYRQLTSDHVGAASFDGQKVLKVDPQALTMLAAEAFKDISHLLRPAHLKQMRAILDDPEASANDKFVVYDLLKNACISAGGVLPM
ncbi:MAG: fumarate hydratase, partial [Alphaproteobacteria bacterium]|nr:fumarate hydratase [Alphaproteobacteria bacterium]